MRKRPPPAPRCAPAARARPHSPAALDVRHLAREIALGVAVRDRSTLVVELLAARQPELDLGPTAGDVQLERHDRLALRAGATQQLVDLLAVEQQLAIALGLVVVAVPLFERRNVGADQPGLALLDPGVCRRDVRLPGADRLDLGPFQDEPGLERVVDRELVARLPIEGDRQIVIADGRLLSLGARTPALCGPAFECLATHRVSD